ncbi:hypothetical protein M231_07535 [Tremella mesenterica]|uniref:Ubiquitin-like domain-containing protein n=1 Tax=Tremella mesenterica TaxID=5217 RepID=A0A4Q1B946_TREME|nr:hypothetical protein M231_07535 [Tremella mesenterica]
MEGHDENVNEGISSSNIIREIMNSHPLEITSTYEETSSNDIISSSSSSPPNMTNSEPIIPSGSHEPTSMVKVERAVSTRPTTSRISPEETTMKIGGQSERVDERISTGTHDEKNMELKKDKNQREISSSSLQETDHMKNDSVGSKEIKQTPQQPSKPMIHLRVLIISGQSHLFTFEPTFTVGRVKELIWSMWPSEWVSPAQPPSPSFMRILFAGRILEDDSTLICEFFIIIIFAFAFPPQHQTCFYIVS